MRSSRDAPVDSVGAAALPESNCPPKVCALTYRAHQLVSLLQVRRYQVLIALMLSSQTKDHITALAMSNLQEHGLTVENIMATSQDKIEELINPVGFYRVSCYMLYDMHIY